MVNPGAAPDPATAQQRDGGDGNRTGDKVRVRSGPHKGLRGLIARVSGDELLVQDEAGETIRVAAHELTNASRSARQSWREKPKKGAGRPRSPFPRKKMVSFRIEVDLWEGLGRAAQLGLIRNKEDAVNTWLRELADLLSQRGADG